MKVLTEIYEKTVAFSKYHEKTNISTKTDFFVEETNDDEFALFHFEPENKINNKFITILMYNTRLAILPCF